MSNTLAIAAVTGALSQLISKITVARFPGEPEYSDAIVTHVPFDEIATDGSENQVNLFLYQITPNATWRGTDPSRASRLESDKPPLALNLHYLLTAYAKGNDDLLAHRLLGRAMSLLHDYAVLSPGLILAAISSFSTQLGGSDLAAQVERVRVTQQVLTIDEMSKLWTMFQAKFRVSAVYMVSVVLIDSALPDMSALPVLTRGMQVLPSVTQPLPLLTSLTLPKAQPSALLGVPKALLPGPPATDLPGDVLLWNGLNLTVGTPELVLTSQLLGTKMTTLTLLTTSATALSVQLPTSQDTWPIGIYSAIARNTIAGTGGAPSRIVDSNIGYFTIAPRILSVDYAAPTTGGSPTPATFTVVSSPQVWPSQRVSLILGDRELIADAHTTKTDTLTFSMPEGPPDAGTYFVRLRVDDVDSLVVSDYSAVPPVFDTTQQVTVT